MRYQSNSLYRVPGRCQRWLQRAGIAFALLGAHLASALFAQNPARVTGLIYYAVENLDRQRVDQRGIAGNAGVAFDRLILSSNTRYRIWLLEAATLRVADAEVSTPAPGRPVRMPNFFFRRPSSHDTDNDQIHDLGEFIVGTLPTDRDSDDDGIEDGPEVKQGLDALSGRAVRTGVIGSVDTVGAAVDISALNDLAVVAERAQGISVFNVFNGMNAVLVAQVDTPGDAQAVASSGNLIAVADGAAGLAVVNISDPPAAVIAHQVSFGASAVAVTAAGSIAYVGLSNGRVAAVDLASGTVLDQATISPSPIQDVMIGGDTLYVLIIGKLIAVPIADGGLQAAASIDSPGQQGAGRRRLRLFAGDQLLYATFTSGYNIFNIAEPSQPALVRTVTTSQFGWKQIVSNGSGIGLAPLGANSTDDGAHDLSVFNLGRDGAGGDFVTTFATPGVASAVSIYNGIAYVADSAAGLQVVNYLAYDARGVPPTISISTSFSAGLAEEGKLMRITARVSDDVQVRNVEFYLDGVKASTDGNFPFEHRFLTPLIQRGKTSFTVRARASDTGGNAAWSDEVSIRLAPDATPPRVRRSVPFNGALVGAVQNVSVYFTEPILTSTLNGTNVRVAAGGPDGITGTSDDVVVPGVLEYRDELKAALFIPPTRLEPGNYRLTVNPGVTDLGGNPLANPFIATFRVFSFRDDDQDGMPDEIEPGLGLDPARPDTDGDGIVDGLEDPDNDGLPNAGEVLTQTDPNRADTDADGLRDGLEDPDNDALSNAREIEAATNPLLADSDADGWSDETEVTGRSNPLDPLSRPRFILAGRPPLSALRLSQRERDSLPSGVIAGRPLVSAHRISLTGPGAIAPGSFGSRPPVVITRASLAPSDNAARVIAGRPPIEVRIGP